MVLESFDDINTLIVLLNDRNVNFFLTDVFAKILPIRLVWLKQQFRSNCTSSLAENLKK